VLGICGFKVLNSKLNTQSVPNIFFILIAIGGFVVGFICEKFSHPAFYEAWSHLGSGTMKLHGRVFIVGDLIHLTSTAACLRPISIGKDVCDP
jgi:hypothetical protein